MWLREVDYTFWLWGDGTNKVTNIRNDGSPWHVHCGIVSMHMLPVAHTDDEQKDRLHQAGCTSIHPGKTVT